MKKFLLVAALAFVTMGASANNGVKKASFNREKKAVQVSNTVVKNLSGVTAALKAIDPKNVKENYSANVTRADGEVTLIPAYSEWTYHYESDFGFIPQIMYSGASYLVKDGKAYLKPFADLGMVGGVVEKDVTNAYSEDGADSITFSVGKIASYKGADSTTVDLFLEPCYIENYAPHRLNQKTFGAYYFAEADELYIPASTALALFTSDETATDPFSTKYVARMLDLLPQADYQENMSKATFTATSYYGTDNDWSGDAQAYLGDGYLCIKGISNADEEAWIEFDATEEDETVYELFQDQWINTYKFYTDATRTETYRGVVTTVGLLQADGNLTGFNKAADFSSFFQMTDNADETSTLENTDNTVYGEYIYGETDEQGGMNNAANMKINILYESVADGIQSVGVESSAKFQNAIYNMAGQRVGKNFKGLVIKNGKKVVVK